MKSKIITDLVKKAQEGNKEALGTLYKEFYTQVFYYTYSRVNNIHIAQDIVSDVFLSLCESIHKYQGKSTFKNYIFGITKNKIKDYIKSKYQKESQILESVLPEGMFGQSIDNKEESILNQKYRNKMRGIFSSILTMMKPKYAKVLDLRFNKMFSLNEIAEHLNTTVNNVKVIQHRAIKQARDIWLGIDGKNYMLAIRR